MITISPENLEILDNLNWMLEASSGEFALMIACCNYGDLQQVLIDELVKMSALHIKVVKLQEGETSLLNALHREISYQETSESNENPIPYSLIVTGWERVEQLEKLLASVNQVRESLKGEFPVPIVFWVNQGVLKTLLKSASDLASWASNYQFRLPSAELNGWLTERGESFQDGMISPEEAKELAIALQAMQRDMEEEGAGTLSVEGRAHLETLLGLSGVPDEQAMGHYQAALEMWQEQGNLEQQGYVCSQLAYTYFCQAFPTKENVQFVPPKLFEELLKEQRQEGSAWQVAYGYVQQTLALWEQAGTLDNIAKTFHRWLGILRYLEHWDLLAQLARQVIPLHEDEEKWPKYYRWRDYSVLAEVEFKQERWEEAQHWSEKVLQEAPEDSNQYYVVLSRLILAQLYYRRGETDAAIEQLQRVRESGVERAPRLHVAVFQVLRDQLFERKDYLEAYEVKRELRTAEFEYNFRGFVGASRLKPRPHQRGVATEIRAAGREKAVQELVARILDTSHVVTVIYGYSGVGKSSLLQAGLVPALAEKVHQDRIVPIVLRRYEDWQERIGTQLGRFALGNREWGMGNGRHGDGEDGERGMGNGWTEAELLRVWQEAEGSHDRIVLIFDQFEEFFFRFRTKPERRALFGLLSEGLERCPKLQVVISIRQDYIHYLFEQRELQRVGDVLRQENAYPLSYFQPEEAVQIIRRLTQKTSFHPEEELLERLVQDLAAETQEVIPIELQIVGSQLEDSYITRLEEYERLYEGVLEPKVELVRRYIQTVVEDCGTEHERSAYWVLFLLTDEDLRRPVKTEPELERELREKIEEADLPLVLKILVGSGLIEKQGEQSYQLVHDYLVRYVREQAPEVQQLQEKLEHEQKKREAAERSLVEIEKQVRRSRWLLGLSSLASTIIIAGTVLVTVAVTVRLVRQARVKQQLALEGTRWERLGVRAIRQFQNLPSQQLEALVSALQTAQELYPQIVNKPVTEYAAYSPISALQQITQTIREQNKIPHQAPVWEVAFSPNGRYLATSSQDNTANITEVETGKILHTIAHQAPVWKIAFSPDGRYLVTGSYDKTAQITEVETGKTLHTIAHEGKVWGVAFSPDGRYLATGSDDHTAKITEVETGSTLHTITHQNSVWGVAFSPDGRYLATGGTDKTAKITEVESGQTLHTIAHQGSVREVAFSPNGRYLATGNYDNTAQITEVENGKTLHTIAHQAPVWRVAFSPNGRYLATGSTDKTAKITEVESGQTLHTIAHEGRVWGVDFSADGRYLATGSTDKTAKITTVESGKTLYTIAHEGSVTGVAFSADGRYLATGSDDKTAKITTVKSSKTLYTIAHEGKVTEVEFSPNGEYLATGSYDNTAQITEVESETTLHTIAHEALVDEVAFSPNGEYLATGSYDNTAQITEVENGKTLHTIAHQAAVLAVAFSPDGRYLATGSNDETAKIVEVESGKTLHTITHEAAVLAVVFSPDGRYLATHSDDETAKIVEVESGKTLHTIAHEAAVLAVAFSPNGRYLATGSYDNTAQITEVESGTTLYTVNHQAPVQGVEFSPNENYLATHSEDQTAKITAIESGKILHTIAHEPSVWGIQFSPNGRYLAISSDDKTAKITEVVTGQTTTLQGHEHDISDMVWHSDGDPIVTGSENGTVRLWTRTGQELAIFQGHQGWVSLIRWDEESRTLTSVAVDENQVTLRTLPVETLEELIARGCRWVQPYLNSNDKHIEGCEKYWE